MASSRNPDVLLKEERAAYISFERSNAFSAVENLNVQFVRRLHDEVDKITMFAKEIVRSLATELEDIEREVRKPSMGETSSDVLCQRLRKVGEKFGRLERYVNLNYEAVHKITKKHAKIMPAFDARRYFISVVRS